MQAAFIPPELLIVPDKVSVLLEERSTQLTPREIQPGHLLTLGHSVIKTAKLMGLSFHTLDGYLKTLHSKLGVKQRAQIIDLFNDTRPNVKRFQNFTPRQRDVAHLLGTGRSYKEISEALSISVDTVKGHVKYIFIKSRAENRKAFVALYTATFPHADIQQDFLAHGVPRAADVEKFCAFDAQERTYLENMTRHTPYNPEEMRSKTARAFNLTSDIMGKAFDIMISKSGSTNAYGMLALYRASFPDGEARTHFITCGVTPQSGPLPPAPLKHSRAVAQPTA